MPEINGCVVHGETGAEALREVNVVAAAWIAMAKEKEQAIPQPKEPLLFG